MSTADQEARAAIAEERAVRDARIAAERRAALRTIKEITERAVGEYDDEDEAKKSATDALQAIGVTPAELQSVGMAVHPSAWAPFIPYPIYGVTALRIATLDTLPIGSIVAVENTPYVRTASDWITGVAPRTSEQIEENGRRSNTAVVVLREGEGLG